LAALFVSEKDKGGNLLSERRIIKRAAPTSLRSGKSHAGEKREKKQQA
jgi:hypothetical protein